MTASPLGSQPLPGEETGLRHWIAQLAQSASVEMNIQDTVHLPQVRALLPQGARLFISHPPRQTFVQTEEACAVVRQAGFEPVPHVPVRLIPDAATLDRTLSGFARQANVKQVLLISGDYPSSVGPYATVSDALRTGLLNRNGIEHVAIAGHPEGHPKVPLEEIRRAEADKVAICRDLGLQVTLVAQFLFEPEPFLHWAGELRARGISAEVVAGVAGPAGLATLFKYAMRCGVGPSVRALGDRPSSVLKLLGERGPEALVREFAHARGVGRLELSGLHMFCFGGFLRSCEWLHAVSAGSFELGANGFSVRRPADPT